MNRNSALRYAIESGDARSVRECLAQGANPNGQTQHTTLLHTAIVLQQTPIVRLLLKHGADAQYPDTKGLYPLHVAASTGSTAIVNALIQAGALLTQTTPEGSTALDLAAASNHAATARALVQAGVDLEQANADGNTPLLTASALGNRGVVQTLLKLGADAKAVNRQGQTALHLALWSLYSNALLEWSHTEGKTHYYIRQGALYVVEAYNVHRPETGRLLSLRDQRAVALAVWGPTEHLSYLEALQTVQVLIKHGQCLTQRDDKGATPLHLACFVGASQAIQALHRAGVALQAIAWEGKHELHLVAASQRLDGLRAYLRCYGAAHINVPDAQGWTPAHYLGDAGGPIEMAQLLGQYGADPSRVTTAASETFPSGTTAARMAFHWKDLDLAMALDEMPTAL